MKEQYTKIIETLETQKKFLETAEVICWLSLLVHLLIILKMSFDLIKEIHLYIWRKRNPYTPISRDCMNRIGQEL